MAEDRHLGTDIRLALRHQSLRPVYAVDTDRRRVGGRPELLTDFGTISGRANLGQAILMRLLTPRGELAALAHAEYGSRLHELVGRLNTETNRNLARLFILDSLEHEPRVAAVEEVRVEPSPGTRDRVDVLLRVTPVGQAEALTVGPFTLELA